MDRRDGWDGGRGDNRPPGPPGMEGKIELTDEDMKVLKRCNYESFWGFLKPNPRFGSTPKILLATLVGYVAGKFSYRQRCAEMIMELPDSKLAEAIRKSRDAAAGRAPRSSEDLSLPLDLEPSAEQLAKAEREGPRRSATDFGVGAEPPKRSVEDYRSPDLDVNSYKDRAGSDLSPSDDVTHAPSQPEAPGKPGLSYDDLRRRNREEYEARRYENMKKIQGGQFPPSSPSPPPPPRSRPDSSEPEEFSGSLAGEKKPKPGVTNKYGDVWEK